MTLPRPIAPIRTAMTKAATKTARPRTTRSRASDRRSRPGLRATADPAVCDAISAISVRHPEVGVDDALVALDLVGLAVGDLAPVVEDHDPVREVHHHAHVVLDE